MYLISLLFFIFFVFICWLICESLLQLCSHFKIPLHPAIRFPLRHPFFIITSLLFSLFFIGWIKSPTNPDRADILGIYEIDRNFYSGANADWQHQTYTLEITHTEAIVRDRRTTQIWRYPIEWFFGSQYRWGFDTDDPRHHMINNGPVIYRQAFSHYYVFKSPLYGNVFFHKK